MGATIVALIRYCMTTCVLEKQKWTRNTDINEKMILKKIILLYEVNQKK